MGRGLNKAQLIGHLGRDPETRYFPNGDAVSTLNVATDESYKNKETGDLVDRTEWHKVVAHRQLAEIAKQIMKKGDKVYVEGWLRTRKWQDKETGKDTYGTEIVATSIENLSPRSDSGSSQPASTDGQMSEGSKRYANKDQSKSKESAPAEGEEFDSDIPF